MSRWPSIDEFKHLDIASMLEQAPRRGFTTPDGSSLGIEHKAVLPKIVCRDGATISVQASKYHYCTPRSNQGPYTHVEVGFPSNPPEKWLQYAEEPHKPDDTIYAYVPLLDVQLYIAAHGGVDPDATFASYRFETYLGY